jgi:isoleucyl-tRNA synthetase
MLSEGIPAAARERSPDWDRLMEVRGDVLKSLENARNARLIGAPLEAHVRLSADGDLYGLLERYAPLLPSLFIVSQVSLGRAAEWKAEVERAAGSKCERCWKYTLDVGREPELPTVCAACAEAVKEMTHA